jgi:AraC-like DNA-binding protein
MPLHGVTLPDVASSEVIVCVAGRVDAARLEGALPSQAIVRWARTTADLDRMLRSAGERLRMVVLAPRDDANAPTAALIREFRQRRPRVALVGYCRATHEHSRDIIELAAAGIHEIIFRDLTDWGDALRQTLARATQSCGAAEAVAALRDLVPCELAPLIEYCLFFPQLATSVPRVAAALGVHRKTLVNYTARSSFPAPSIVINWCRLIIAAHLLASRGGGVERVALSLEYPSATALRNTLRRYTGLRPAELRQSGMELVLAAFTRVLSQRCNPSVTSRAS